MAADKGLPIINTEGIKQPDQDVQSPIPGIKWTKRLETIFLPPQVDR